MRHINLPAFRLPISKVQLEKICSTACFVAALIFLIISFLGAWRYIFISAICLAASVMVKE